MENAESKTYSIDTTSSEQGNVTNTVPIENNEFKDCTVNINQGGSHSRKTTPHANEKFEYCLPQSEVIGRDEEANELLELVKTHRQVVISGMSGIGKSSLAAHCARTWSPTFISNAIFIDAETDDRVKSAFDSMGLTLDIQYFEKLEQRVKVEMIYKTFKDIVTLVIFDNVTSFSVIRAYLPPKGKDNFYVIITAQLKEFGKVFHIYYMPLMSKNSSLELIEIKFTDDWDSIKRETEKIETLIEKMQSHPFAIIQAVAYISDQLMYGDSEYTVQNYLREFDENFNNIKFEDYWEDAYRYESVYTALLMNMEMVEKDKEFGDKAKTVLHCMAFLDPSRIKKDMFLYLCDSNDKLFNAVIRLLRKYSLTDIEKRGSSEYIIIHRLIQHTSQCMLKEKVETLKLVLRNTLKLLINSNTFYQHRHFILPHMGDFKLSDFDECYIKVYSSGPRRKKLTEALCSVNLEPSAVEGWTAAHYAAFQRDIDMLELLEERGKSFSVVSQHNWTILHAACINIFDLYKLDYIIGLERSNLNKQTRDQNTALHVTLMTEVCNYYFSERYFFDCAQDCCYDSVVKYFRYIDCDSALILIDSGCDITLTNKDGDTAAHLALRYRNVEVLKRLLKSPGVDITKKNNEGHSVSTLAEELHLVIYRHKSQPLEDERVWYRCIHLKPLETLKDGVELLKRLIEGGGDVPDGVYQDIVQLLDNIPLALRVAAGYMLHRNIPLATFKQYITTLPEDTVPSPVQDSWFGHRPTNIYVLFCDILNYLVKEHECAFELLSYMSYVGYTSSAAKLTNKRYSKEDIDASRKVLNILSLLGHQTWCRPHKLFRYVTATYNQIRGEEKAVCAAVIKARAWDGIAHAVRVLGISGVLATYRERDDSASAEVQADLDTYTSGVRELDVGDLDQWSALHWAVYQHDYFVAKELLRMGVSPDSPADDTVTPLHLAALRDEIRIIELLCAHGAKVNVSTTRQGLSPLHLAAFRKHRYIIDYLLNQGANENARDSARRTPNDIYEMLLPTDSSRNVDDPETSDEMSEFIKKKIIN